MAFINHYRILQVDQNAEPEVIEVAFKRLALKYHPDQNNTKEASEQMRAIIQAYDILRRPETREKYDQEYWQNEIEITELMSKNIRKRIHEELNIIDKTLPEELIYQSDFSKPSGYWEEACDEKFKAYREEGWYCIRLLRNNYTYGSCPKIFVDNFKASVTVKFSHPTGRSKSGILLIYNNNSSGENTLSFSVSSDGWIYLDIILNGKFKSLYSHQFTVVPPEKSIRLELKRANSIIEVRCNGKLLKRIKEVREEPITAGIFAKSLASESLLKYKDFCLSKLGE